MLAAQRTYVVIVIFVVIVTFTCYQLWRQDVTVIERIVEPSYRYVISRFQFDVGNVFADH